MQDTQVGESKRPGTTSCGQGTSPPHTHVLLTSSPWALAPGVPSSWNVLPGLAPLLISATQTSLMADGLCLPARAQPSLSQSGADRGGQEESWEGQLTGHPVVATVRF